MPSSHATTIAALGTEVSGCRACPRLVAWREQVALDKRAAFRDDTYWARPVPGFGDPRARVAIVGLAPAAHGGNRTGRVFTGDRSGDFLFASLHRTGFANQPISVGVGDGLVLHDLYITAAVKCAPPANKPTPAERDECRPYLVRELEILDRLRVIVVLGAFAYEATWTTLRDGGVALPAPRPRFAPGLEVVCGELVVLGAFHPSQQNTFTGKLTPPMLDSVFARANELVRQSRSATISPTA
jgi:uracil-DNA glycosylase family 4